MQSSQDGREVTSSRATTHVQRRIWRMVHSLDAQKSSNMCRCGTIMSFVQFMRDNSRGASAPRWRAWVRFTAAFLLRSRQRRSCKFGQCRCGRTCAESYQGRCLLAGHLGRIQRICAASEEAKTKEAKENLRTAQTKERALWNKATGSCELSGLGIV